MISRDHHSLSLVAKYSYLVAQQCHAKIPKAKTKQKQKNKNSRMQRLKQIEEDRDMENGKTESDAVKNRKQKQMNRQRDNYVRKCDAAIWRRFQWLLRRIWGSLFLEKTQKVPTTQNSRRGLGHVHHQKGIPMPSWCRSFCLAGLAWHGMVCCSSFSGYTLLHFLKTNRPSLII